MTSKYERMFEHMENANVKEKIDKCNYIKMRDFSSLTHTIKRVKRQEKWTNLTRVYKENYSNVLNPQEIMLNHVELFTDMRIKNTSDRWAKVKSLKISVTKQDPLGPSQNKPFLHILCFSSSLKNLDNSI